MSVIKSYSFARLNLQVECEGELLGNKVKNALDYYFFLQNNSSIAGSNTVKLKYKEYATPLHYPGYIRELFSSPQLRVLKNGTSCYLIGENSFFHLELTDSHGTGYLKQAFWDKSPKSQQEFLMLSFLWLFHEHDLFAVHGNALVKDRNSILIAGDSGSGKSTTALSLIQQGWKYLSDDVTLLEKNSQGVHAFAFQKGFSIDPRLIAYYPELSKLLNASTWNGQKRFLDIAPAYPDRCLPSCVPNILIFPKIISESRSRLIPINKTNALILLMQNSGGVMVDKGMASKQVGVLKELVNQTSNYQLLAGRDLYKEPARVSEVLAEIE